jgi:protein-tyrosine phosphatase
VSAQDQTPRQRPLRILFVCLANLCRSPLAKVISETFYGGLIEADSAGVAPARGPVFPEMAAVVRERYGADLSGHQPRHVLEYPVAEYDHIIAMDSSIFLRLSEIPEIPVDRLSGWEVADPVGLGIAAYERAAIEIEENLARFMDLIGPDD